MSSPWAPSVIGREQNKLLGQKGGKKYLKYQPKSEKSYALSKKRHNELPSIKKKRKQNQQEPKTKPQPKSSKQKRGFMPHVRHKSLMHDRCLLLNHHPKGWNQITINSLFDMEHIHRLLDYSNKVDEKLTFALGIFCVSIYL